MPWWVLLASLATLAFLLLRIRSFLRLRAAWRGPQAGAAFAAACSAGNVRLVQATLSRKVVAVDVTAGALGTTGLQEAACAGRRGVVEVLLSHGASVDKGNLHGFTALHFACGVNDVGVLRCLLDARADLAAKNKDGWTPLHVAARSGAVAAVDALVSAGADTGVADSAGLTPLAAAVNAGQLPTAAFLCSLCRGPADDCSGFPEVVLPLLEAAERKPAAVAAWAMRGAGGWQHGQDVPIHAQVESLTKEIELL